MATESYQNRELAPAGTLLIRGRVTTGKHAGPLVRTVTLETASGERYNLDVHLEVIGTWKISSDALDLGEVLLGDPRAPECEGSFVFTANPDELLAEPQSDAKWLRCAAAQRDALTTEVLVRVDKEALTPGVHTADVLLKTSSDIRPDACVYVRVRAVPALIATPTSLSILGDEVRRVTVSDRARRPVALARAESSDPGVLVTVVGRSEIAISAQPGARRTSPATITIVDDEHRTTSVLVTLF